MSHEQRHLCNVCQQRRTTGRICQECSFRERRASAFKRVLALVDVIRAYQAEHQRPPTTREIADILGLRSCATVMSRIDFAVDAGLLTRDPRCARSLRVVEA